MICKKRGNSKEREAGYQYLLPANAVGKRIGFPVSDVRAVRYDGEKLVFEWAGEPRKLFDNTKIDGQPLLASFAPDDARRFAAAVNARKGRPRHL